MTDETTIILAVISVVPPTMAAIASALVAFAGLRQGQKNAIQGATTDLKVESSAKKVEEVHELVNGNLSNVKEKLETAVMEVQSLKEAAERKGKMTRSTDS